MSNRLKDLLKGKLTKKELKIIPSSFDVVGNILIFSDFPQQLSKKEKIIGNTILNNYKHINIFKSKLNFRNLKFLFFIFYNKVTLIISNFLLKK